MKFLPLFLSLFFAVPAGNARQAATTQSPAPDNAVATEDAAAVPAPAQAAPAATGTPAPDSAARKNAPGHPLDPADVDILTGKRDRALEIERRNRANVVVGGSYGIGNGMALPLSEFGRAGDFDPLIFAMPLRFRGSRFFSLAGVPPRGFRGGVRRNVR